MLKRPKPVTYLRLTGASLLLLALVASCGDDAGAGVAFNPNGSENSPVVAKPAGDGDGMEALIEGTLALSNGCLMLGEYPVIWPYGTTWDAEGQVVQLSDGQTVALGDRVQGGGGFPYLSDLQTEYAEALAGCPTNEYGEIAMFNSDEQITVTK